jgi:hypothetical protein
MLLFFRLFGGRRKESPAHHHVLEDFWVNRSRGLIRKEEELVEREALHPVARSRHSPDLVTEAEQEETASPSSPFPFEVMYEICNCLRMTSTLEQA